MGLSVALTSIEIAQAEVDLGALVGTYSPLLFRVAHSVLRSPSEAEDVVQDVFLRVLKHRSALPSIRDLRVWLVRIAWNLALDRRRQIRPEQIDQAFAQTLTAQGTAADNLIAEAQGMQAVLREIERLPRAEREVLLLSAIDELSIPELAQVIRRSESAVRALLFRARARLRQRLEKGSRP